MRRAKDHMEDIVTLTIRMPRQLKELILACAQTNYSSMNTWVVARLWQSVRKWIDPATGKLVIEQVETQEQVGQASELDGVWCMECENRLSRRVRASTCQDAERHRANMFWENEDGSTYK